MIITEKTYVSQILKEYGDIAEIMEVFGVKRAGSWGLRKLITHFITIKSAAKFHKVPLTEFMTMVQTAIDKKEAESNKKN